MYPDRDYGLFAKVVELGSLSAAGRALGLSPGMVSRRLARLEERLGARLLHRTTRRLALTSEGEQFHRDVIAILAAIEAAEARLSGADGAAVGALRISAPTSFGRMHVAPYLKPFLDAHPRLRLELDLSDEFVSLIDERTDVAIRITSDPEPALAHAFLARTRRVLCAAPAYLRAHGEPRTLEELHRHRLLAASGQSPWRLVGPEGGAEAMVSSHVRTNSSEVVRELALAGVGIALRSNWDVGDDLAAGRLVRVLSDYVLSDYEGAAGVAIFAAHPRAPQVPAKVVRFIDYLRALYTPVPPWERGSAASGR